MADALKVASWLKQQLEAVYQEYLTWPEWRKREIEAEWLKTPLRVMTEKEKEEQRRSLNMMTEPTKEAGISDEAYEIAMSLVNHQFGVSVNALGRALEAYAAQRVAEAIERCAQVAHNAGRYSDRYLDGDIPQDVVTHNRICWSIRDGIRALKELRR